MALTNDEWNVLHDALKYWASQMPDEPVLGFLEGESLLTPHQLLWAIENADKDDDGAAFMEMLEHAIRRTNVAKVARRFWRAGEPQHR